jgi:hypothetical protein
MKSVVSWASLFAATALTGACGEPSPVAPVATTSSPSVTSTTSVTPTASDLPTTTRPVAGATTTITLAPPIAPETNTPVAYSRHRNARFGFSCEIPANFLAQQLPANGDGFGYQSPDGRATVSCSAHNNLAFSGNTSIGGANARQAHEQALASRRAQGDSVTYNALVGNAITLSGYSGDNKRIYYERILWGAGSVDTLYWSYPRSLRGELDAAVGHSAATFRPGDLSSGH